MWDAATSNAQNRAMLNVGEASIYLAIVRDTQPCEPPKTLQTAGSTDDNRKRESAWDFVHKSNSKPGERIFHDLRPGISSTHGRGPQCNHAAIHVMLRPDATLDATGSWSVQTSLHGDLATQFCICTVRTGTPPLGSTMPYGILMLRRMHFRRLVSLTSRMPCATWCFLRTYEDATSRSRMDDCFSEHKR